MIPKFATTALLSVLASPAFALTCVQDFDYVSPVGHDQGATNIDTLKRGMGAGARGDLDAFMAIAADPYIQHSPDLPDGWKPVYDLTANRAEGFVSTMIPWVGPTGFMDNGNYLVMFREVNRGDGSPLTKIFDLLYFDEDGLYAEHWDMQQPLADSTASGRSETAQADEFANSPVSYDIATEEANKRVVASFLNLAFNAQLPDTALGLYAAEAYVQHSPQIADGRQAVQDAFDAGTIPTQCYDIQFILAQNDLVWVYSKVTGDDGITAVVDMMRVRDGVMVEHWDVLQPVPDTMPHDNGMF